MMKTAIPANETKLKGVCLTSMMRNTVRATNKRPYHTLKNQKRERKKRDQDCNLIIIDKRVASEAYRAAVATHTIKPAHQKTP